MADLIEVDNELWQGPYTYDHSNKYCQFLADYGVRATIQYKEDQWWVVTLKRNE